MYSYVHTLQEFIIKMSDIYLYAVFILITCVTLLLLIARCKYTDAHDAGRGVLSN